MSKARSGSSFVREGRQRLGSSSSGTTSIPIDPNFRAKNRRTVEQWDKDDGNYVNYTNPGSADSDWLKEIGLTDFNSNSRIAKIQSKFSEDTLTAIHNYTLGSGRFNIPLITGAQFEGSNGPNNIHWHFPKYFNNAGQKDLSGNGQEIYFFSPENAKKLEKAFSRAFKYETDRGIIVARGTNEKLIPSVGDITQSKGYTSTAYDGQDWGILDNLPVRYIIRIPRGTRILHASSQYRDGVHLDNFDGEEREIILRKNAVFRTTAVKKQPNGQIYVYQDLLGYGSKNKFKNRFLNGTPDHSIYYPVKM